MKVSVLLWDAGFRERFHTLECLANQTYPSTDYEVHWVEYFDELPDEVEATVERHDNFQASCLDGTFPWHAGRCVNEGIRRSDGDLVVVLDGDVVVRPEFIETAVDAHRDRPDLSMHFQRWDEQDTHHGSLKWEELKSHCVNDNPENYGGALAVRRQWIEAVSGCDSHPRFQRASAVFGDLHQRLVNLGLTHEWHPSEILLHPWHPGTGAIAEHARFKHQHSVIEQRKRRGVTAPDVSYLTDGSFDEGRWTRHARLYYYYSLAEAHLYDKTVVRPYRGLKWLYRSLSNTTRSA